jgi:deoxyadenosine/deoxycytidine kinase
MSVHKPIVICIEGIISVGKTSLIRECLVPLWTQQGLRVKVIDEPVDKWKEILPMFYEDPKRWAYHFQSKAFHDRVVESKRMWDAYKNDTDMFICDRGIFSDPGFMEINHIQGNVTNMEMEHYKEWWNMWSTVVPFIPDMFIYLTVSVDEAMIRLKERSRNGENRITPEYQQLLKNFHDNTYGYGLEMSRFVREGIDIPVLKVDASVNYKSNEEIRKQVANYIFSSLPVKPVCLVTKDNCIFNYKNRMPTDFKAIEILLEPSCKHEGSFNLNPPENLTTEEIKEKLKSAKVFIPWGSCGSLDGTDIKKL